MTTDELKKLVEAATPGRRVQFHGLYCEEADGTDCPTWDSSHETSVILPDGSRYRGYAWHKHAADASLDALAPALAREVIALRVAAGEAQRRLADCVVWMDTREKTQPGMPRLCDMAREALIALHTVLGESE
jgi:hypothetical protein